MFDRSMFDSARRLRGSLRQTVLGIEGVFDAAYRRLHAATAELPSLKVAVAQGTKALDRLDTALAQVRSRAKIHYVYFVLASFEVAAVSIGLLIASQSSTMLTQTVEISQSWSVLQYDLNRLRQAGGLFAGDQPVVTMDLKKSVTQVQASFVAVQESLAIVLPPDAKSTIAERLGSVEAAMQAMAQSANDPGRAGPSDLQRRYLNFVGANERLARSLWDVQRQVGIDAVAGARKFRALENLLWLMMIQMICGIAFFGHWVTRKFNQRLMDIVTANQEARLLAERLQKSNADVGHLNVELAAKVNDLYQAQEEIIRKGKLAQLGQLTATVAHEIRNPLGAARTAAFLISRKVKDKGIGIESQLQRIDNGIKRCDSIISELLDFARSKSLSCTQLTVDEWVKATVDEEVLELSPAVKVVCNLTIGDRKISFDADRMRRVIVNLVSNAAEAMVGRGGVPAISIIDNPTIKVTTGIVGETVELSVADNGPGISEENLKRIMEPLFTTKSFGVGLGLSAVEKVLEQHGGGLRIASRVGEGTTMTAWFPIDRIKPQTEPGQAAA